MESDFTAAEESLRARYGPVAPVTLQGGVPAWLVLGYEENLEVMRDAGRFTRDSRAWNIQLDDQHPLAPLTAWQPLLNLTDGEEHTRLRKAVVKSLSNFNSSASMTESAGHGIQLYVARRARLLIDEFIERGKADLVSQFADLLPLQVIAHLLGLSEEHVPALVGSVPDTITGSDTAVESNRQVTALLYDLVDRKTHAPGHDITSRLIAHKVREGLGGDDLRREVAEHLRMILTMTHSSMPAVLASTLRMMLTDSRFRGELAGLQMTLPDAVEQVLWDFPPMIRLIGRWALVDTWLAGQLVKKGDLLVHAIGAANRDPKIRPDINEPLRGNKSHVSFSAGAHECPGQDLVRGIASVGIDVLHERLRDLRLAVPSSEVREEQALMSRHLNKLPVTFTPGKRVHILRTPPTAGADRVAAGLR